MMTDSLATKEDFAAFGARFDGADKHIEIRLEEFEKRLAVRFGEIDRRFGDLDRRLGGLDRRVEELAQRFGEFDRRLGDLDRGFQTNGHRLSGLESAVGAAPTREELDSRLRETDARITGEFADLERRLTLRLGGIMVAGIGAMSALLRLL